VLDRRYSLRRLNRFTLYTMSKEILDAVTDLGSTYEKKFKELEAELKAIKAKGGRMAGNTGEISFQAAIENAIAANYNQIKTLSPNQNATVAEVKTFTIGASLTGNVYQSGIIQNPIRPMWKFHFRNVIPVYPTATGSVLYPVETSPIGTGSFDYNVEGNTKNSLDYDVTTTTLVLKYLAGLSKASRESLADLPFLMSYLGQSLVEDFAQVEDEKYYNLLSIAAVAGVTSETLAGAKVLDYATQLETTGHNVTGMIAAPDTWAKILKTKPNDYDVPGGLTISDTGVVSIAGLPLYKSPAIPTGKILIGDFSRACGIAQCEGFNIRSTEYNSDDFEKNLICFRAEARCGLMIFSPESFVLGSV
jgi:HK97 family phage major capsid protein